MKRPLFSVAILALVVVGLWRFFSGGMDEMTNDTAQSNGAKTALEVLQGLPDWPSGAFPLDEYDELYGPLQTDPFSEDLIAPDRRDIPPSLRGEWRSNLASAPSNYDVLMSDRIVIRGETEPVLAVRSIPPRKGIEGMSEAYAVVSQSRTDKGWLYSLRYFGLERGEAGQRMRDLENYDEYWTRVND